MFSRLLIVWKNYFSFKDIVPEPLRSFQIYNFTCASCSASYTGKDVRHMKGRVSEHQGVSLRTRKHTRGIFSTSVRDHMLDCNHLVTWDDFKVLGMESNHWLLDIKESLLIKRDRPLLNRDIYSQELFLISFYNVSYKILLSLFAANGYIVCKFTRLLINSFKQFNMSVDVYLIMEAVTSESS